jgi:hypothetical protein
MGKRALVTRVAFFALASAILIIGFARFEHAEMVGKVGH